jgi:lipoprotein-anchoring transpeptidase ErfK/SrfK
VWRGATDEQPRRSAAGHGEEYVRYVSATALLALILAAASPAALAQTQDFEDLVEDALERNAQSGGAEAPAGSAIPPSLRVIPDAGAPATESAPAGASSGQPLRGSAEQGPRPYTPPRRAAAPAEEPATEAAAPEASRSPSPDASEAPAAAPSADPAPGAATAQTQTPAGAAAPASQSAPAAGRLRAEDVNAATFTEGAENTRGVSAIVLKAQILLDRAGASPGVIDGIFGSNVAKAIAAVETVIDLPVDGRLDPQVWAALGGDQAPDVLVPYTITEEDAAYPFLPSIPRDYSDQAKLPSLGYASPREMFAERFHMDVDLLTALNPNADFRTPGNTIMIAAVEGAPITGKISRIEADKARRQVRAYDAQNRLVVAYPATIGSSENPSPSGTHQVRAVAPNPVYYYDPRNFVQGQNVEPLELPPGPNNPVGTMWIDLTEPSYGIHGTPEPSLIDKTASHGCVRLTNWDAEELATLVEPGVTVEFVE